MTNREAVKAAKLGTHNVEINGTVVECSVMEVVGGRAGVLVQGRLVGNNRVEGRMPASRHRLSKEATLALLNGDYR